MADPTHSGLDKGIGLAYLADEMLGWTPRVLVPPVTPVIGLTDGESVITNLLGNKVTGLEKRLLGYLAGIRCMLRCRDVVALAHLTGKRQYADAMTKDDSIDLLLEFLYSGDLSFEHVKQTWERVVWGKEQILWEAPLKQVLRLEKNRLEILLEKGRRRGGDVQ